MEIKAVIGANYGDEGKGLVANFLAKDAIKRHKKPIVILNNGGPQRGHTVICGNNKHIFHHFGSGTMQNAPTFIADQFMVNPIIFVQEYKELVELGYEPMVYIDPNCYVTTPYEILCSQCTSFISKDVLKVNDTCGLGIWETVKSIEKDDNSIRQLKWFDENLYNEKIIVDFLRKRYVDCQDLFIEILDGKSQVPGYFSTTAKNAITELYQKYPMFRNIDLNGLNEHWIKDLKFMIEISKKNEWLAYNLYNQDNTLIVENGQGLLLDRDKDKRFGTPSYTGSFGVCNFVSNYFHSNNSLAQIDLEMVYVSRPYITRHGAGKIDNEFDDRNLISVLAERDTTNVPNEFQGTIRFGSLDVPKLCDRITEDFGNGIANSYLMESSLKSYKCTTFFTHAEDCNLVFKDDIENKIIKTYKESYNKTKHSDKIYVANSNDIKIINLK